MKCGNLLLMYTRMEKKHFLKNLSIVLLFVISINLTHMAVFEFVKSRYDITVIKDFFPDRDMVYNIQIWPTDDDIGQKKFIDSLSSVEGVEWSGIYYSVNREFDELKDSENFLSYNENIVEGTEREGFASLLNICYIDRHLIGLFGLDQLARPIRNGIYPILVGAEYGECFSKGEIYTDEMGEKYQVCGFIPYDFKLPSYSMFFSELPYENMNKSLITLYDAGMDPMGIFIGNAGSSIYCKTDGTKETIERIEKLARQYFLHISVNTINEKIDQYKIDKKQNLQISGLFASICVIGAFIAMTSSAVIQIILKKQEYGIMYANGMSFKDSFNMILLKNIINFSCAFVIGTIISASSIAKHSVFHMVNRIEIFKDMVIAKTFGIVCVIFVISTFIPVRILGHMTINDMLRGNEL